MNRRTLFLPLIFCLALTQCTDSPTATTQPVQPGCEPGQTTPHQLVPVCLADAHIITPEHLAVATALLDSADALSDSLEADTSYAAFNQAADLTRSLIRLGQYYADGLFADSARFNRMLDEVRVTIEDIRGGSIRTIGGRQWPATTPNLAWYKYASQGIGYYFQPVTTVHSVAYLKPRPEVTTDSLVAMGEALWHYAIWHQAGGKRFPIWEYLFTWNSGGLIREAPWQSGMAQGYVLMLFAEILKRTNDPLWLERGKQVLTSMQVTWDDGGVLIADTLHGYWWEEFHPLARVWNGSAQAVLGVGYFAHVSGNAEALRMFQRGIEAMKYFTPEYDTGTWTLYSRIQGYATVAYHHSHIEILKELGVASGDPWFTDLAAKWSTYTPPPGVH